MANPPRSNQTTPPRSEHKVHETARTQKAGGGSKWIMYLLAAIIAIIAIIFLLSIFGASEEEIATEPAADEVPTAETAEDFPATESRTDAPTAIEETVTGTAPETTSVDEATQSKNVGDPAADNGSDDETIIEVEGDAEVEILDETPD